MLPTRSRASRFCLIRSIVSIVRCDVDAEMYGHLDFHDKVVKRVQSLPRLKALRVALVMRAASRVKELVGIMPISERLDTGICQVESSSLLTREEIWPVLSYLK